MKRVVALILALMFVAFFALSFVYVGSAKEPIMEEQVYAEEKNSFIVEGSVVSGIGIDPPRGQYKYVNPDDLGDSTTIPDLSYYEDTEGDFVYLTIQFGDYLNDVSDSITGLVPYEEGMTVYDVTINVLEDNNIDYTVQGSGSFAYITQMGDLKAGDHGYMSGWLYYVNGESPNCGAGAYILAPMDSVMWIYS